MFLSFGKPFELKSRRSLVVCKCIHFSSPQALELTRYEPTIKPVRQRNALGILVAKAGFGVEIILIEFVLRFSVCTLSVLFLTYQYV
jgi:hypothetical protein